MPYAPVAYEAHVEATVVEEKPRIELKPIIIATGVGVVALVLAYIALARR